MSRNQLKRRVCLISESQEQELLALETKIFELQGDSKALEAYSLQQTEDDDDEKDKRPYQVHEGIAIIEMKGPLVSRTTWMSMFMGAMSYEDLRSTFVEAITDDEVQHILIDADTPGGHVNGLGELSGLIQKLRAYKPIDTYVAGSLCSAGYWVGASTGRIYASDTSFIGSIGVVVTHTSYEKMLEKEGIKVTKIKSGEKKQVGSSEKDLTAEDKAYLQGQVDDLFGLFKRHVLSNRPQVNADTFDGSEFVADKALAMGLVDRVMAFDDVLTHIVNQRESNGGSTIMKKGFTAERVAAAAASGATLEDLELASGDAEAQASQAAAEAEAAATAAAEAAAVEVTAQAAAAANAQTPKAEGETVSAYLESQLAKANDKITDLTVETKELSAKIARIDEHLPKMKVIVSEAVNRMMVALGLSRIDLSASTEEALIKQYEATSDQFNKTFKPGGLTGAKTPATDKPKATITNIDDAKMRSVGM